jgi:membrane-associated phospholipid phosphatase
MSTFVAPPTPTYAEATPRVKTAKVLTDVFAPANLVIALLLLIGWHSTSSFSGVGWGLFAAFFCGIVPMGIIHFGVRRGKLTDKHIRVRRQRIAPLTATLASVVTGIVLLNVLDAPREVFALVIAMLVGLASALTVTVWWQISVHNAVAGGAVMILVLVFGQALVLPAVLFVVAMGWSRRVLKAHTLAQLVCGTALGSTAALVFTLLR